MFGVEPGIEIRLQTPGEFEIPHEPEGWFFTISGPLVDLTGTNPSDFHQSFSQSPPSSCLMVPHEDTWWHEELLPPDGPTLSPAEEDGLVVEILHASPDCELPCWWGITPGVTGWPETQELFLSHGKGIASWESDLGMQHRVSLFGRHSPYPFDYVLEHHLIERDGVVFLLGVKGYSLDWSDPVHFSEDWQRLALDRVLARYGPPSQVLLHYWQAGWRYTLGLAYDRLGVLVSYTGALPSDWLEAGESPVVICPTIDPPTEVTLWLADPSSGYLVSDAFARFGYVYPVQRPFLAAHSLEETTGWTVGEFYETYLDGETAACLEAVRELGEWIP
jgi:hypothetical protein